MDRIIIGFSGKQYAGKTTLAKAIIKLDNSFSSVDLAKPLKEALAHEIAFSEFGGFFTDDIRKNKEMMQQLLTKIENNKGQYRPRLIELGKNLKEYKGAGALVQMGVERSQGNIIIENVRTLAEYNYLNSIGGFLIRVNASEDIRSTRGVIASGNDITETELDNVKNWFSKFDNEESLENVNCYAQFLYSRI